MTVAAGTAMTPSSERCQNLIVRAMTDSCSTTGTSSNVASVNVALMPSFSDVTQKGAQVNVGYPSFIIAGKSPTGLSELPWDLGWSTAQFKQQSGMNDNNQVGLSETTAREAKSGTA